MIWRPANYYRYSTVDAKPSWNGATYSVNEENCKLNDKTVDYKTKKLYGTYYFLATHIIDTTLEVQNVIKIAASFAALAGAINSGIFLVGKYINSKVIIAKLIRTMYFV